MSVTLGVGESAIHIKNQSTQGHGNHRLGKITLDYVAVSFDM